MNSEVKKAIHRIDKVAVKNIPEIKVGTPLQVKIREKLHNAEVEKRPFVQKKNKS